MSNDSSQRTSEPPHQPLDYAGPASRRPRICATTWNALALAIASFVAFFGFLSLLVAMPHGLRVLILVAIAAAMAVAVWLAIRGRRIDRPAGVGRPLTILVFGLAAAELLVLLLALIPPIAPARETANRVKCASNLRQIGQACLLYANSNGGAYPDTLARLIETGDADNTEMFCCPSADSQTASGPTTQALVADFAKPGRCSYTYVGSGLKDPAGDEVIVAYEPLTNHDGDGMNILFGGGHVEFVPADMAKYYLSELAAGHNPPRPVPLSSTQPRP